jgi:hypothetical protein
MVRRYSREALRGLQDPRRRARTLDFFENGAHRARLKAARAREKAREERLLAKRREAGPEGSIPYLVESVRQGKAELRHLASRLQKVLETGRRDSRFGGPKDLEIKLRERSVELGRDTKALAEARKARRREKDRLYRQRYEAAHPERLNRFARLSRDSRSIPEGEDKEI